MTPKILFPTDFSSPAQYALDYAVDLANRLGAKLTLLHTFRVYSTAGMFVSVEQYLEEETAEEMLEVMKAIEDRLDPRVQVSTRILRGEAAPTIAGLADAEGYDLIIMGTQGASGLEEVFTGSTTNGVIRRASTPVLVIPDEMAFRAPRHIVLAVDGSGLSTYEVIKGLVLVARAYQANVLVFHQDTGELDRGIDSSVAKLLDGVPHSIVYELHEADVRQSIKDYMADTGAGMLCMVRRERGFLERIFHNSMTQKEVFNCSVPLLVLNDHS
ncbi:MAG: universal stress protein [Lewinella sp.]|nr:universal stress protein [Lewinella sp.]